MTYADITALLSGAQLYDTERGLERAIREEAQALQKISPYNRRDGGEAARTAAREFYAEDITNQLREPMEPTPDRVLSLRRFPVTWAVAEVLRTNGLVPQKPERKTVTQHEDDAAKAAEAGDWARAAESYDAAAGASIGIKRAQWYQDRADECRKRVTATEHKSTLGPWGNGHMPSDGSTDK